MSSQKRLRSVCQSIAHHAASSLSWLHPHVAQACRDQGVEKITINLLESDGLLANGEAATPLQNATKSLAEKFHSILLAEGFLPSELAVASISLAPDVDFNDDYSTVSDARLQSHDGQAVRYVVNCLGRVLAKGTGTENP